MATNPEKLLNEATKISLERALKSSGIKNYLVKIVNDKVIIEEVKK